MLCLWPVHIISIYSRFSHVYVFMCVGLYTHAYMRMHRYMHIHTYTCSVSWEISVWFINFIHVLDYPIFFYVLWRSLCLYHVYFKRWYVLCIHKPRLKHDVLPYIYIYICVCVCIFFSTWCVAMFLWRSRIIAVSANVFSCCLYLTINKVYLILSYLIWTNAGVLLIWTMGTNFNEIFNRNYDVFTQENAFESVVCETAAILPWPQCVKIENDKVKTIRNAKMSYVNAICQCIQF